MKMDRGNLLKMGGGWIKENYGGGEFIYNIL
jgi:hypothetical protein